MQRITYSRRTYTQQAQQSMCCGSLFQRHAASSCLLTAIQIVCTTTLALGSRELSTHGAIVTRLAAIEDLAGINMVSSLSERVCELASRRLQQQHMVEDFHKCLP